MRTEVPESREVQDEQFWRDGGGFHWCWPKFDRVRSTDKRTYVLLNRYPHNVIGIMLNTRNRGYGIRWKCSP